MAIKLEYDGKSYEVGLVDDGTLDTVISINGKEHRFDQEYAASFRDEKGELSAEGLEQLAKEAIELMDVEESKGKIEELTTWEDLGWKVVDKKPFMYAPDLTGYKVRYKKTGETFPVLSADEKFLQIDNTVTAKEFKGVSSVQPGDVYVGDGFVYGKFWELLDPKGNIVEVDKAMKESKKIDEAVTIKLDPIQAFVAGSLIKWAVQQPEIKAESSKPGSLFHWENLGNQVFPGMLAASKSGKSYTADGPAVATIISLLDWAKNQPEVIKQSQPPNFINMVGVANSVLDATRKVKPFEKPTAAEQAEDVTKGAEEEKAPEAPEAPKEEAGEDAGPGNEKGKKFHNPDEIVGESILEKKEEDSLLKDAYKSYVKDFMKDEKSDVTNLLGFQGWVEMEASKATGKKQEDKAEEKEVKAEKEEKSAEKKIEGQEEEKVKEAKKQVVSESTVAEWEAEVAQMTPEERASFKEAIEKLRTWKLFQAEFDWTGIFALSAVLGNPNLDKAAAPEAPVAGGREEAPTAEGKVPEINKDTEGEMVKKLMEKHGLIEEKRELTKELIEATIAEMTKMGGIVTVKDVALTLARKHLMDSVNAVNRKAQIELIKAVMKEYIMKNEGKVPEVGKETEAEMAKKLQEEATVDADFGNKDVQVTVDDQGTHVTTTDKEGEPLAEPVVNVIPDESATPAEEEKHEEHEHEETPEEEAEEHVPAEEGKVPEVGKDSEGEMVKKLSEATQDNMKKFLR
jgi:hypothetical protein